MQRQNCFTLLCLLKVFRDLKGRGVSVRWRWSSQAVSVGLHCAGRTVLACLEGDAWRSMSRRKRGLSAASVYDRRQRRKQELWARGERLRGSEVVGVVTWWSPVCCPPGLAVFEGQALKRRKETLTLDVPVQPIDKQFVSARPRRTRVRSPRNCWQQAGQKLQAACAKKCRIAACWQVRRVDGDEQLSATGRLRARNTIAGAFQGRSVLSQACL